MADGPPIIIKKIKKGDAGHHGGAWKVAYADFVTAMMAFFLLLWLLSVTTAEQRRGIADYFAPVSVSRSTSGSGGVLGGQTITAPGAAVQSSSPIAPDLPTDSPPGLAAETREDAEDSGEPTFPKQKPGETREEFFARMSEVVLKQQADETRQEFLQRIEKAGLGTLLAEVENLKRGAAGGPQQGAGPQVGSGPQAGMMAGAGAGAGQQGGQPYAGAAAVQQALAQQESQKLQEVAQEIRQAIQSIPDLQPLAQNVQFDQTPEGLRIQIVDQEKKSMFPGGGSQMYGHARELLGVVARAVAKVNNPVTVSGHTDSTPFARADIHDNWELSSDRANAARRALQAGGLPENRVLTVVGRGDRDPLLPTDPKSPQNRRISIVLHRQVPSPPPPPPVPAPVAAPVPAAPPVSAAPAAPPPARPVPRR